LRLRKKIDNSTLTNQSKRRQSSKPCLRYRFMNTLFPIFVKLHNRHVLIVGGGYVGWEKLQALMANSPEVTVTVVAPQIRAEIVEAATTNKRFTLVYDSYNSDFLKIADLVLAATNFKEINAQIYNDCQARKIWVNVADTPDYCDFYLSSVVKKGDLKIAISTNGKSPTLAKRIRALLEEIIPESIQETLDNLQAIRNKLKGDFESKIEKLNEITKILK
jgi:precorrin-2 dehydrogenase / sirohydrochlorin ferrochelatase